MFKSNLIRKTVKIVAIGTICLSLSIPSAVNAAHDVYKPKEELLIDFNKPAFNIWKEPDDEGFTAGIKNDETRGNYLSVNVPNKNVPNENWYNRTIEFLYNGNIAVNGLSYLVFDMKLPSLSGGYVGMKIHANTESGRFTNDTLNLEYSKNFSDTGKEVKKVDNPQSTGNWPQDNEWYQWRVNLEELFGENYSKLEQCYAIQIEIANWGPNAGTVFEFDNFRLESGDRGVYQTFDGISNANDVAWYQTGFSASIENRGYLNSPALKLTGKGDANTQIVFDRGHTVNLLANGNYLYWYMDVDVDTNAAGLNYKPEFVNAGIKILTESWTGNEDGLIRDDTAITYADSLSGVFKGEGTPLPNWNGNKWALRLPVGKHWFRIDLTKAFKPDYTEEVVKESLSKAKALYLQYNSRQEGKDGQWESADFTNILATFIIDSISTSVKDFKSGDADGNGVIDILDLVTVNDCIKGIYQPVVASADTNGNNKLDDGDLAHIRKSILKII